MMDNFKIHHLVVLGNDSKRALISDRELISHAIATGKLDNLAAVKVGDITQFNAPTVDETMELRDVLALMDESELSAILIVNGETLTGVLTETDMFRALRRLHIRRTSVESLVAKGETMLSYPTAQSFMHLLSEIGI